MNEKLIDGYTAYTDADEFGTAIGGDAPASVESISWATASAVSGASVSASVKYEC